MVVLTGIAAFACCCVLVFDTSSLDEQVRAGISIEKIGEVSGKTAEEIQEILKEK